MRHGTLQCSSVLDSTCDDMASVCYARGEMVPALASDHAGGLTW